MNRPWNQLTPGSFHIESTPDYLPLEQLRKLQLSRLQATVRLAYDNVARTRGRMQERSITPDDIRSLDDIAQLPFTVKTDLRDTYPFGLFAVPMEDIVRLHASSGTTGKPIVVGYTHEDLSVWTSVMVRSFAAYGLFTGGLGAHAGAEALGATVIPISGGNTERQIMVMKDFGVTAICCTPSYFVHLLERAAEMNIRPEKLRAGIFGAEPWSQAMRQRIQADWNIRAFDIYGLSEIIGPGVGIECQCQDGLHLFEDHFYPEIIDPQTGAVLPDGQEGELVLTTLSKRAMPMIRYRTRDITTIIPEPCACGRTIRRIKRISRRSDDMLIIRGVNVFPSQIEAAILNVEGTLPHYQIVLKRHKGLDTIEVRVEVTPELFSDKVRSLETLQSRLVHSLMATTGLHIQVTLVEPRTLQRSEGKAKRVIDQREGH
jgi:phenylacetate-CoA ligase